MDLAVAERRAVLLAFAKRKHLKMLPDRIRRGGPVRRADAARAEARGRDGPERDVPGRDGRSARGVGVGRGDARRIWRAVGARGAAADERAADHLDPEEERDARGEPCR